MPSQPARTPASDELAFGEADLESERAAGPAPRTVYPPPRARRQSDIHELGTVPGSGEAEELPGSIEEAVQAHLDRIERLPSTPPPGDEPDAG